MDNLVKTWIYPLLQKKITKYGERHNIEVWEKQLEGS